MQLTWNKIDNEIPPIASSRRVRMSVVRYEAPSNTNDVCPAIFDRFVVFLEIGRFIGLSQKGWGGFNRWVCLLHKERC